MANFRTKARAIDLLGKNQIADLPTAITELWKNGYDAYGDYLSAKLYEKGYEDIEHPLFSISDDGHGMTDEDILNKWIVIGTDSKRNDDFTVADEDRFGKEIRIPLGEKGIGRLSVAYLGNHMLMVTKKKDKEAQLLFMNWRVLENYEMFLDDIEIPVTELEKFEELDEKYSYLQQEYEKNFENESWNHFRGLSDLIHDDITKYAKIPHAVKKDIFDHFSKYGHGTYFVIFDPIDDIVNLNLEDQKNIKDDREDIYEQTRYIKSALSGLFNPFDCDLVKKRESVIGDVYESPKFTIYNANGMSVDFLGKDFYTQDDFDCCEHWIDGKFDESGFFTGKIKVFGDVSEYSFKQRIKIKTFIGELSIKVAFWEGQKSNSSMSAEKWNEYEKKGEFYSGLYVYRDGFRVLPYGRTDFDFLEFEKRRSMSAGQYYFSHRKMFGYIGISKKGNPTLVDKSGREGFVSNEAYRELKRLLTNFFKTIAAEKYGTKSKNRIDHLESKKQEAARIELIKAEKKKNRAEVINLQDEIDRNTEKLSELALRVKKIDEESLKSQNAMTAKALIADVDEIIAIAEKFRVVTPKDVSLYGYDEVENMLFDYNEKCNRIINLGKNIIDKMNPIAGNEAVIERYINKYNEIKEEITKRRNDTLKEIKSTLDKIYEKFEVDSKQYVDDVEANERTYDSLRTLSSRQISVYQKDLEKISNLFNSSMESSYIPLVNHLNRIFDDSNWLNILNAYKTAEAELSHRLDEFYELAQIGMAIDVVDHQFNALYGQISRGIKRLSEYQIPGNYEKEIELLKMEFQHMEENQKMLMPLYRRTRKKRKEFSGEYISEIILQFYGEVFKNKKIEYCVSDDFKKYRFYTYESLVIPVFLNIIDNAIYWVEYAQKSKVIKIDVKDDKVLIANSGARMQHTELKRCFELFYSNKAENSGRGIGLFLARRNLSSVDMGIYATNDPEYNMLGGACFVITKGEWIDDK